MHDSIDVRTVRDPYSERDESPTTSTECSIRVLIVDDDVASRTGLAELLRMAGYHCTLAASFPRARNLLRAATPDLLITDIRLGAYNGLHLVVSTARQVPAIVVSGFDDPMLRADALAAGAAYLTKPVNPRALMHAINRQLRPITQVP